MTQMKQILESWKKNVNAKNLRLVVNNRKFLSEEELADFPLSSEELESIKAWGGLSGEPSFLGSGTMGSAYLFSDNKVLKITSDFKEAAAAKLIEGASHPNVYTIRKVGRRWERGQEPLAEESRRPFLIVYDMVGKADPGLGNFPTSAQRDVIVSAFNSSDPIWRNWPKNFIEAKKAFYSAIKDATLPDQRDELNLPIIFDSLSLPSKHKEALQLAWEQSAGLWGKRLLSLKAVESVLQSEHYKAVEDIAAGLTFLKDKGVDFRDLKATNLMNVDGQLVIIDIGKSGVKSAPEIEPITQ